MKKWTWHEDGMYPAIERRVEILDLCDDENVEWCLYSDHEAELAKKDEEIARLRKEIEELKDALSGIREREE